MPPNKHQAPGVLGSTAITLLAHWGIVHNRPSSDDDIEQVIDGVLMPLL